MKLAHLSDAQLLESLTSLVGQGRVVLARLLAHLVEVEERRLHLEAACPSMFRFCVLRLGMSEDEACRRIHAARLVHRFPGLLVRIERGELTLSTLALLHDALTPTNYEDLVQAAAGKTKAEVQTLLAQRSPKPDVPATMTSIPAQAPIPTVSGVAGPAPGEPLPDVACGRQLVPLSATRHKVQFTAGDELRRKLERAQDLMPMPAAISLWSWSAPWISCSRSWTSSDSARPHVGERRPRNPLGRTTSSRACRARHGMQSSSGTASAAPSPMPTGIAARPRPGSSWITSPHARVAAPTTSVTCASAAEPTIFSTRSGSSAGTTSSARFANAVARASADTRPRAASSRRAA